MRVAQRPGTTGTEGGGRGNVARDSALVGESPKRPEPRGPRSQGGRGKLKIPTAFGN